MIEDFIRSPDSKIPSLNGRYSTLDGVNGHSLMKIYCSCGRIVGLDRSEMNTKLALGKELECIVCRNHRIARDIEDLDRHFDGSVEDDSYC